MSYCFCGLVWQVLIDFGHLSFANTQALNRKKTVSEGQDSKADMEGKGFVLTLLSYV